MFERETTHAERVTMIERHLAGASLQSIATALNWNYFTVRTIWRTYQQHARSTCRIRRVECSKPAPAARSNPWQHLTS
jgi:hypothetical protein